MPPPVILDPAALDFSHLFATREQIEKLVPHRHEFALLDAVVNFDRESGTFAGYHDIRADEWWARGHIPGRPIFPGVLMIEVAAQLASFLGHLVNGHDFFMALVGVDDVKYRGTVEPPCRFVVVGKALDVRKRRTKCATQGFVNGTMVFEAVITGMAL
jgi:3-hydroxyacyl-[acyl-carrier-protein] dehydratase